MGHPKKILCVEDEALIRADIADELRDAGYEVMEAANGEEALAAVPHFSPDLILCDVNMPRMNGRDLLREVRALKSTQADLPFIFLTAYGEKADILNAHGLGVDDYLIKPIDFDLLLSSVSSRLASYQRARRDVERRLEEVERRCAEAHAQSCLEGLTDRASLIARLSGAPDGTMLLVAALPSLHKLRLSVGAEIATAALRKLHQAMLALPGSNPESACQIQPDTLCIGLNPNGAADELSLRLRALCELEWVESSRRLPLTPAVVVAGLGDGRSAVAALSEALTAVHFARTERVAEPVVLDTRTRQRLSLQQHIEGQLLPALLGGEMSLHLQPRLDLRSRQVVGAEALIRWNSPLYGLIPPALFIPMAERLGHIEVITDWCLARAAEALRTLGSDGSNIGVSVNASGLDIQDGFVERVDAALRTHGVDARRLTVEITETALLRDRGYAAQLVARLRESGVRVAIDDFGLGYSSLSYLRQFPLDAVKIDRSFVQGIHDHAADRSLCEGIINLARSLGLQSEGEGIESEADARTLLDLGCDVGQGYWFGRPMPFEQFRALVAAAA